MENTIGNTIAIPISVSGNSATSTKVDGVDVVTTSGGKEDLTEKAVAAARSWRYRPAYRDGEPVESYVAVTVRFD